MTMLDLVLCSLASVYALWAFYLASMALVRARADGRLGTPAFSLGLPIVAVGLLLDCAVNLTVASLLFLDAPRELLVTRRLKRYHAQGSGWRTRLAAYVCKNFLDQFDPTGEHCD